MKLTLTGSPECTVVIVIGVEALSLSLICTLTDGATYKNKIFQITIPSHNLNGAGGVSSNRINIPCSNLGSEGYIVTILL